MDPITIVLRSSKTPAASAPVGGEMSAAEIDANFENLKTASEQLDSEKQPKTLTVGSALATTGTVNLDLAALTGTVQTIAATGAITFTTSNRVAGRHFEIRIAAGAAARTITWPAWVAFGAALPTTLAIGEVLTVAIRCMGTTDASIDATSALSV